MDDKIKLLKAALGDERIKKDELLKYHVFSKLGGPAEIFYIATSQKELTQALDLALDLKIPYFVFGAGTRMLISDNGIKGFVIKNRTGNIKIGGIKGKVGRSGLGIQEAIVEADSGVSIGRLNEYLASQGLKQIEGASSLQSTIGGSIFLDPSLKEISNQIKVWEDGEILDIDFFELNRHTHIVLSIAFKLKAAT